MSEAYEREVRALCPQARVVHDPFHIVAKYGREVLDRVRVDEPNRLARAAGADPRPSPRDRGHVLVAAEESRQPANRAAQRFTGDFVDTILPNRLELQMCGAFTDYTASLTQGAGWSDLLVAPRKALQ